MNENEAKYTVPRTKKTPEEKHLSMLDKVRQQAFYEGVKATAKHLKAPIKSTVSNFKNPAPKPALPAMPAPAPAPIPEQRPSSQWMSHVKETRAQSGKSMKEAMVLAKISYKGRNVKPLQ
jgi:hypothetical protein